MTFSIMTLSVMAFSLMTLSIMAFGIMTLSIRVKGLNCLLQKKGFTEYQNIAILSDFMLSVVMLGAFC